MSDGQKEPSTEIRARPEALDESHFGHGGQTSPSLLGPAIGGLVLLGLVVVAAIVVAFLTA